MKTDALARRVRTKSQPTGKRVQLTPRVRRVLAGLRRYSPLPTPLIYHFWQGEQGRHYVTFQNRMKDLFHEAGFVTRPSELNPDYGLKHEPSWYALSPAGQEIAEEECERPTLARADPWHHRAMGACIGVSFEALASDRGIRAIHEEEIFAHPSCPDGTKSAANPLVVPVGSAFLEPDALMGIEYPDGFSFYAREHDRGTESFARTDRLQTSVKDKLDRYIELFGSRAYKSHWGLPNLAGVLFITTQRGRVRKMLEYLADKPYADRFLFKVLPEFGSHSWRAPREPIAALFEPWETISGAVDLARGN